MSSSSLLLAVLLQLTPVLRPLTLSLGILFTYIDAARTQTYRKHITWSLSSQSIGSLAGPTENIGHVTATYCCVTSPRTQRKHSFTYCCVPVFRAWPRNDVLLLLRVGTCLRSYGLAMVFTVQYESVYNGTCIKLKTKLPKILPRPMTVEWKLSKY
jgi:hypothetical protein